MISSSMGALGAVFSACLVMGASAGAQSVVKATGAGQHVSATLIWPQRIAPGKPFNLMLSMEIEKGYHVQANTAKDFNIPTTVQVVAPKGFKVGKPVFPAAKKIQVGKQADDVFEGLVGVRIPITAPAGLKGAQKVTVKAGYQICNDKVCLPPAEITLTADLGAGKRVGTR